MESRNFQLDTEWNIIHYPEQPQGFGILIIGDERHFVDENTSFWIQNEGKKSQLKMLQKAGYTLFYSNLYGKHWGSDKAVKLAKRLYEHVIRTEIMNGKIHVIAEGMGALAALKLINEMGSTIRSIFLINPILSLQYHLELEKDHKFFYKKLLKELAHSYETDEKDIIEHLKKVDAPSLINLPVPMKVIHILAGGRAYKQSQLLNQLSEKWEQEKVSISVFYMVPEKKQQMADQMISFFKSHEEML